jgi:hypothetical protein
LQGVSAEVLCFGKNLGADALQLGTISTGIPAQAPRSNDHTPAMAKTSRLHVWTIPKAFLMLRKFDVFLPLDLEI